MNSKRRIAIVGSGPAGCTLACLLARAGMEAVIFDDEKRPEMVVGESLIPLLVTVFRRLGIEEKVAALGTYKPGVTWSLSDEEALLLSFDAIEGVLPTYAYNVPRREFDQLITDTALEAGAKFVKVSAKLELVDGAPELSAETLALVPEWGGRQPDLLIDASGRRRLFAKLLGIGADVGLRKDVSHFAHYEGCVMPPPSGQTLISRLKHGWGWRIPLPGKVSVGVVINKEHAKKYGDTPEEQLERIIEESPVLISTCRDRVRISPVTTYANYQLISHRGHGRNWTAVGDSFGFVDPMLSPGLCMAMVSAERLADVIIQGGDWESKAGEYIDWFRNELVAWQDLIDYFYDGRIFALFKSGMQFSERYPGKFSMMMQKHMSRHIAGMAAGGLTTRAYSRGLLRFMSKYATRDCFKAEDYAVQ
ncbi:NAD(P)/FAD-dependent oxidoreductase [Phragmitibacter flavus]|uniref:NAD(P)/FAD-dependent oxidoreductase n=1 Tax=Phragmitibacter flavus TaxID=2576071 RepID=UPI0014073FF3|nr:NAD(P)/FAD-dependent oxidoreductase [Phragmitibacter flavus]